MVVDREDGSFVHLTDRELEVLRLVGQGFSSRQIGLRLRIARKTVEGHVDHLRLKLGAANRCHLIAIAASRGLLEE